MIPRRMTSRSKSSWSPTATLTEKPVTLKTRKETDSFCENPSKKLTSRADHRPSSERLFFKPGKRSPRD